MLSIRKVCLRCVFGGAVTFREHFERIFGKYTMQYYEKYSDEEKYIYLKKQGEPFSENEIYKIDCLPNFHGSQEFIFITSGEVQYNINGNIGCAGENEILFVDSMYPHSYKTRGNIGGYILVLSEWFFLFYRKEFAQKKWQYRLSDRKANAAIIRYVGEWHKNIGETNYDIFNNANILLAMLSKAYPPKSQNSDVTDQLIYQILNYVEEHYNENISLAEIADKIGYVKQYCSRVFNRVMGESFRSYLNRVRVLKADDKLHKAKAAEKGEKKATILEIAMECGFESMSTFYRAYREVHGGTPKQE